MKFEEFTDDEKIEYLIKAIIKSLQLAGGQLTRDEIKDQIFDDDEEIAKYSEKVNTSKKTGERYKPFNFKFNWAIKDLSFVDIVTYQKRNPLITLTEKGINIDLDNFDVHQEVMIPSKEHWDTIRENNKKNRVKDKEESEIMDEDVGIEDKYNDDFKDKLLDAISKMSPKKFEAFSRALLTKMGVSFTDKGTQLTNDGGLDGFGYHRDPNDFRTSKVVIQCKRFNTGSVQSPDIDKFLGVVSKNQADYGIFITNSRFSKGARETALQGKPITLIDGDNLVELIKKYQLYVKPITTYELLDFYNDEN